MVVSIELPINVGDLSTGKTVDIVSGKRDRLTHDFR
jgi:hypothetical protein